jgi:hypothetical protein
MRNRADIICRLKARIAQLEAPTKPQMVRHRLGVVRILENAAADRVQVFFDGGRLPRYLRDGLKQSGFRWSAAIGCWQPSCRTRV